MKVENPTGSGNKMTLLDVSKDLCRRVTSIFKPDENGRRPCHGDNPRYSSDPFWKDLVLFYEYFDGNTGRGCGARYVVAIFRTVMSLVCSIYSHQTGWTALAVRCLDKLAERQSD